MRSWLASVALSALVAPHAAMAQSAAADPPVAARVSVKATALLSRAPAAPWLFPVRNTARGLGRARLDLTWRPASRWSGEFAYEHRVRRMSTSSAGVDDGLLPADAAPPYRLTPLDWRIAGDDHQVWTHEIDRAAVRIEWPGAVITAGRQSVGWGRGLLFSAVDVFAPFSPLDIDREWRRGIDALRLEVKLGERASAELIGAAGAQASTSVVGARLRGYTERFDIELVGGQRARDRFAGITTSLAVGGAAVHAEGAVFATPAVAGSVAFANARTIATLVAGASYRLPLGTGLLIDAEYHYSGFGTSTTEDILPFIADPAFAARYARGDTQILGRHAIALITSYEWSPLMSGGLHWLQNPRDGSGLLMPLVTITPNDRWSLLISAYVPYGRSPHTRAIRSEYGLTPLSCAAQLRFYR